MLSSGVLEGSSRRVEVEIGMERESQRGRKGERESEKHTGLSCWGCVGSWRADL